MAKWRVRYKTPDGTTQATVELDVSTAKEARLKIVEGDCDVTFGGFTASVDNRGRVPGDVSKRRSRHVGYHGWAQDPAVYGPIINSVFVSDTRRRHVSLASGVLGPLRRQSGAMPHVDRDGARNRELGRLPRRNRDPLRRLGIILNKPSPTHPCDVSVPERILSR